MVDADKGIGAEEVKQRDKRGAASKAGGDEEEGEDEETLDVTGGRSGSFSGASAALSFAKSYYTVVK